MDGRHRSRRWLILAAVIVAVPAALIATAQGQGRPAEVARVLAGLPPVSASSSTTTTPSVPSTTATTDGGQAPPVATSTPAVVPVAPSPVSPSTSTVPAATANTLAPDPGATAPATTTTTTPPPEFVDPASSPPAPPADPWSLTLFALPQYVGSTQGWMMSVDIVGPGPAELWFEATQPGAPLRGPYDLGQGMGWWTDVDWFVPSLGTSVTTTITAWIVGPDGTVLATVSNVCPSAACSAGATS